jgi:hypothetical protein
MNIFDICCRSTKIEPLMKKNILRFWDLLTRLNMESNDYLVSMAKKFKHSGTNSITCIFKPIKVFFLTTVANNR